MGCTQVRGMAAALEGGSDTPAAIGTGGAGAATAVSVLAGAAGHGRQVARFSERSRWAMPARPGMIARAFAGWRIGRLALVTDAGRGP